MSLKDAIKNSLKRAGNDDPTERSRNEELMIDINARCEELRELGLTFSGRDMSYTYKDFNVHQNEIAYSEDDIWDAIIEGIKVEMKRRAETKPFKDIDRETCEHYWGILTSKCSGGACTTITDADRKEFIDYLLDIDSTDPILTKVDSNWDVIMKEYVNNFCIPTVKLDRLVLIQDWKHYNG